MGWYFEWGLFLVVACSIFALLFYAFPAIFKRVKEQSEQEKKEEIKLNVEEPEKRCPICAKKMSTDSLSGIVVDRCTLHGIWFDNGELESVVKYIKSGGNASVFLSS
jgi:hypothetical protein